MWERLPELVQSTVVPVDTVRVLPPVLFLNPHVVASLQGPLSQIVTGVPVGGGVEDLVRI